jgi:replicative DNA helicase
MALQSRRPTPLSELDALPAEPLPASPPRLVTSPDDRRGGREERFEPAGTDLKWLDEQLARHADDGVASGTEVGQRLAAVHNPRKLDGAAWVLSAPREVPACWGREGEVLAAIGEATMLVGPSGVGKTTVAQQYVKGRLGLIDELLGLPIQAACGRVLYLAMDRPLQAARSFRRMVDNSDAEVLRERLVVWTGPLPINVLKSPQALAIWVEAEFPDAKDVVIDSLKDLAPKLSDDEVSSKVNVARQELVARGVQVFEIHHQRKEQRGQGKPKALADVYGGTWLTAGAGSVVLLWGEPGDLLVELTHLKQPAEAVGPFWVRHDHGSGVSCVHEARDLEAALINRLTVKDAARYMFETADPKPNETEKARRKLESLVRQGRVERVDDVHGVAGYVARGRGP